MKIKSEVIIIVASMTLIVMLFFAPLKHKQSDTFTVTTKDAVKVTITVNTIYRESLVIMPIKKDGIEHSIRNLALANSSIFAQKLTSFDIYDLQRYDVESVVYKSVGNATQSINISDIRFENAFMEYIDKNGWFGEITMIKTN